jgi:integrase
MQQSAIKIDASKSEKEKHKPLIQVEFERALRKCENAGLNTVVEFLKRKASRNMRTAINYSRALQHLNTFTKSKYNLNLEQTIQEIKQGKIDVYRVLDSFVAYLQDQTTNGDNMMSQTISTYLVAVKSCLGYADIDIVRTKFRNKVTMPRTFKEEESGIDANDIREIINHCDNKRLKAYLLVLASGGMRATEALAIREIDIDWNGIDFANREDVSEPAGVKIRKEFAKTRRERHIFISNEAARYLNDWLNWKYRLHPGRRQTSKTDLVFAKLRVDGGAENQHPSSMYRRMHFQFQRVLHQAQRATKREEGILKRGLVIFHSFRKYVKSTVANQTRNDAYAEWLIGHQGSPYYSNKAEKLKAIYKEDCMKFLTFLDYGTVESEGRSYEAKAKQLEKDNELLKARVRHLEVTIDNLQKRRTEEGQLTTDNLGEINQIVERMVKEKMAEFMKQKS